jgi:hypothetical protein
MEQNSYWKSLGFRLCQRAYTLTIQMLTPLNALYIYLLRMSEGQEFYSVLQNKNNVVYTHSALPYGINLYKWPFLCRTIYIDDPNTVYYAKTPLNAVWSQVFSRTLGKMAPRKKIDILFLALEESPTDLINLPANSYTACALTTRDIRMIINTPKKTGNILLTDNDFNEYTFKDNHVVFSAEDVDEK